MRLFILFILLWSQFCLAQTTASPLLSSISSLRCTFPKGTSGAWEDSSFKVDTNKGFGDDILYFSSIDLKNRTAKFIGNQGTSSVTTFLSGENLNFLESTPSGNLILTTVFPSASNSSFFPAVMSRHISIFRGGVIASQEYGSCKVWD